MASIWATFIAIQLAWAWALLSDGVQEAIAHMFYSTTSRPNSSPQVLAGILISFPAMSSRYDHCSPLTALAVSRTLFLLCLIFSEKTKTMASDSSPNFNNGSYSSSLCCVFIFQIF